MLSASIVSEINSDDTHNTSKERKQKRVYFGIVEIPGYNHYYTISVNEYESAKELHRRTYQKLSFAAETRTTNDVTLHELDQAHNDISKILNSRSDNQLDEDVMFIEGRLSI